MIRSGLILMIRQKVQAGQSPYSVGKELGISKNTAKKYADGDTRQHQLKGRIRPSKLEPYKPSIDKMIQSGIFNCVVIYERLQELGYPGDIPTANMSKKIIQLNEEIIKGELKELVRSSVEETLNNLLDQEAKDLTKAAKYERIESRQGYRAGHYDRNLTTTSGNVTLKVPKLKGIPFETAIIERYRRRESSVEEALIEMYLAGVSVRRVEDITEALWGTKVSPSTISELNKKAYVHIEQWRNRPLQSDKYPLYLCGRNLSTA